MDIDLLARMVKELIISHDLVGLPGVGTFVAEMIPATFSDKGFTINPPYRRLSFYPSRQEDSLLIDLYARSNQISREAASDYITQYLAELKTVLEERKTIVLPGLGRLRATRENTLFFVSDEDLDIFPAGIGLGPVSLKSHVTEEQEPVVIGVPVPTIAEEIPDQVRNDEATVQEEEVTAQDAGGEEADEMSQKHLAYDSVPHWTRVDWREPEPKGRPGWVLPLLILAVLTVLFLVGFAVLARLAPDFIDSLLYTPDQLRIINY